VANRGAVALYLGMLASSLDRFDDAAAHFAEAIDIHEGLRSPYWMARTQLEQGRMLLARGAPGDSGQAMLLLDDVEGTAGDYGFASLTRHAATLRS
jgi:hypothetical protein